MNLINDRWIAVRRADGTAEPIAPWQLTEDLAQNPILAVASPRPDFDGALTQFLIGLLQTTCTPKTESDWWDWREKPPAPEELRSKFETVAHAFELDGEKAFMQDASPSELTSPPLGIAALLMEAPGEQTTEQNKDHFVKRGKVEQLCSDCTAAALFALQTNAPSGGQGYRTGLRGGGPLTTVILGRSLWETCWLNVLEEVHYFAGFDHGRNANADRFPWLAKTRSSEARPPAGTTTTGDMHPDQQFWAMPRRIRLMHDNLKAPIPCDLCGAQGQHVYRCFSTRNYGVNYEGFEHPLSPHYIKDDRPNPVHPQPGGIGYRHWLGLVESSGDGQRKPAKVIERFRTLREDGRLWAFGYDMDNMKARCWYDANMPLLAVPEEAEPLFKAWVERMVQAANLTAYDVRQSMKSALFGKAEVRGDLSFVTAHFWSATEGAFYARVQRLRDLAPMGQSEQEVMASWLSELRNHALATFDQYAQTGDFDARDPRRIALARNGLSKALGGKKLREALGLPSRKTS